LLWFFLKNRTPPPTPRGLRRAYWPLERAARLLVKARRVDLQRAPCPAGAIRPKYWPCCESNCRERCSAPRPMTESTHLLMRAPSQLKGSSKGKGRHFRQGKEKGKGKEAEAGSRPSPSPLVHGVWCLVSGAQRRHVGDKPQSHRTRCRPTPHLPAAPQPPAPSPQGRRPQPPGGRPGPRPTAHGPRLAHPAPRPRLSAPPRIQLPVASCQQLPVTSCCRSALGGPRGVGDVGWDFGQRNAYWSKIDPTQCATRGPVLTSGDVSPV
jgi:hypothetical protein